MSAGIFCKRGGRAFLLGSSRTSPLPSAFSFATRSITSLTSDPSSSASSSPSGSPFLYSNRRGQVLHISQLVKSNGKRAFLVDTLALVRRLEAQGVPTKHAEAITSAITEVLNDSLENVAQSFVSKGEMQKSEMIQDANLSKFKSEVQSSQEHHFSLLQRETEKLRGDIEKMRSELRYEMDKVTAGQRLDLNLERGRIRDELAKQNAGTTDLTTKLDREIHTVRAQLEAAKYDVIKYCIGTPFLVVATGERRNFEVILDESLRNFEAILGNFETIIVGDAWAQIEAAKDDVIKDGVGANVSISAVGIAVLRILM